MTIARAPDFVGVANWKAWRVKMRPIGERGDKAKDGAVAVWVLHCPGAHACWSYWWLSLVHLRPIEGAGPVHIATPGAGWEVQCFAQHPDTEPDPDDLEGKTFKWLSPVDWIVQFGDVKTDAEAERVVAIAVRAIMGGRVSPDSDFRRFWKESLPATAKCVAEGGHPPS